MSRAHTQQFTRSSVSVRRGAALAVAAGILALVAFALAAPLARADGDPASDVLADQRLFLPVDANIPIRQQLQLNGLLEQTAAKGYPLRVAIVATPNDLGSVTALWRRPRTYARFLGSELAFVFHGTVLVVMPNGYGVDVTSSGTRTASGEAELPLPGRHLGSAAITAVERFATSAGAPVAPASVTSPAIARPTSLLPWVVFILGLLTVGLAWGASLRRRPVRLRSSEDQ